ncbi:MAG: hypothetical protein ACO3GX_03160 [Gemmataceae bacterium]
MPVEDICRKVGFCQATFFRWKKILCHGQ